MAKTMIIAFPRGGRIPASITGKDEQIVSPHEPVTVPADYGQHLVDDRFAYKATAKQKKKAEPAPQTTDEAGIEALSKAVEEAKVALEQASELDAKAAAQAALEEAEKKLAEAQSA